MKYYQDQSSSTIQSPQRNQALDQVIIQSDRQINQLSNKSLDTATQELQELTRRIELIKQQKKMKFKLQKIKLKNSKPNKIDTSKLFQKFPMITLK